MRDSHSGEDRVAKRPCSVLDSSVDGYGAERDCRLKVRITDCDGTTTVGVVGELDLATVSTLREAVEVAIAAPADRLVIELSELAFIDAAGLNILLDTYKRLTQCGEFGLVFEGVGPRVRRVFEICGLENVLSGSGGHVPYDPPGDATI